MEATKTKDEFKLYYDDRLVNTFTDLNVAINHCKVLYESELTKCEWSRSKVVLMRNGEDITQQAIESEYIDCRHNEQNAN